MPPFHQRAFAELRPTLEGLGFSLAVEHFDHYASESVYVEYRRDGKWIRVIWDGQESVLLAHVSRAQENVWTDVETTPGSPPAIDRDLDDERIERMRSALERIGAPSDVGSERGMTWGRQIRIAEQRDAAAIAQGEWDTAATPGRLVGRPGEIPLAAFAAKIAELSRHGCYWVAEEGGAVIGHSFLDPMEMAGNAHVFRLNIVVHPGHTARGVGTALMTELMGWADGRAGLGKIELLVRASNTRAIALYRKFGFVEEGRLRARVRTEDGRFLDDLAMAWFPPRGPAQTAV